MRGADLKCGPHVSIHLVKMIMQKNLMTSMRSVRRRLALVWLRLVLAGAGAAALLWFLVRVIPKPSRAGYPCQRAAFPMASAFVVWLCGLAAIRSGWKTVTRGKIAAGCGLILALALGAWTLVAFTGEGTAQTAAKVATDYHFIPNPPNTPVGVARGVFPGRVVWARDPLATRWAGHWQEKTNQWWRDENTDQARVDVLLASTITRLTGAADGPAAWSAIFEYYNRHARGLEHRGYQPGEVVAVKINLNNSEKPVKEDNYSDATPQTVLAMVRQLVNAAHVRPEDILVYDARRYIPPYILTKVWAEFKDVRFVQSRAAVPAQPPHPVYGDYRKLEAADWVQGVEYSNCKYKDAKLIPKQVFDATYLVNLALLKGHSYPYNTMENGDQGQTGITMGGKNHFGSIKGTPELHPSINTDQEATPHAYSPIVDLASSPNLGGKTILFVLDGLYSGRKWRTYPVHFPNPPFNNRVEPYENPDWPASMLASLDGVALDSVGLDLLFAQTQNNNDTNGHPRILVRANAADYLMEMAQPDQAPSGMVYHQGGKPVTSLGVHEHWNNDVDKKYSRNLDPVGGQGIELIYLPPEQLSAPAVVVSGALKGPEVLPRKGLAEHDFFYAGEGKEEKLFIVRDGKVAWSHTHDGRGEISDAVLEANGNILFAHQYGVTEISPDKKVVWNYDAPTNTEIHTAQPYGPNSVWFVQNGNPARFVIMNKRSGAVEQGFELPVKNPTKVHGQFRHARLTEAGTLMVAHMDLGKAAEYDLTGKELWALEVPGIWSANPLKNGNVLVVSNRSFVREVNRKGETVWEWTSADAPEYHFSSLQLATRLTNGNTVINQWHNQWAGAATPTDPPVQAIEVTPGKKVVWALRSWAEPANLGPATTIQFLAGAAP